MQYYATSLGMSMFIVCKPNNIARVIADVYELNKVSVPKHYPLLKWHRKRHALSQGIFFQTGVLVLHDRQPLLPGIPYKNINSERKNNVTKYGFEPHFFLFQILT